MGIDDQAAREIEGTHSRPSRPPGERFSDPPPIVSASDRRFLGSVDDDDAVEDQPPSGRPLTRGFEDRPGFSIDDLAGSSDGRQLRGTQRAESGRPRQVLELQVSGAHRRSQLGYICVSRIINVSSVAVKQRLTREESRARTRAAVTDAAAAVFARRGFAAATMEEIALEAGFTRGAVYSNFVDKEDLFAAVLDERLAARAHEISSILEANPDPNAFFTLLARSNAQRSPDDELTWELLRLEFRMHGIRNPEVLPRVVEANRKLLSWVTDAVRAVFEASGIEPPQPYEELGAVVQALDEGLTLLRLVDPERIRPDLLIDTLGTLLRAANALDTTPTSRER